MMASDNLFTFSLGEPGPVLVTDYHPDTTYLIRFCIDAYEEIDKNGFKVFVSNLLRGFSVIEERRRDNSSSHQLAVMIGSEYWVSHLFDSSHEWLRCNGPGRWIYSLTKQLWKIDQRKSWLPSHTPAFAHDGTDFKCDRYDKTPQCRRGYDMFTECDYDQANVAWIAYSAAIDRAK